MDGVSRVTISTWSGRSRPVAVDVDEPAVFDVIPILSGTFSLCVSTTNDGSDLRLLLERPMLVRLKKYELHVTEHGRSARIFAPGLCTPRDADISGPSAVRSLSGSHILLP